MKRSMSNVFVMVAILVTVSCRFVGPLPPLPPPPDPPQGPVKPIDDIRPSVTIFESERGWNIPGIFWHERTGLIVTTYKSDRRPMGSRVYLNVQDGRKSPDFVNGAETIGQPFSVGSTVYFPQEHVDRCLTWDGAFAYAARSRGRWSVCGFNYRGRPALAFNNSYNGAMRDHPRVCDALTAVEMFTVPVKMMPRSMVEWNGKWWVSGDTGTFGTWTEGKSYGGNVIHMAVMNGRLYGGAKDGKLYTMTQSGWADKVDLQCSVSMAMVSTGDTIYYAGGRPNRLYEIVPNAIRLIGRNDLGYTGPSGGYFGSSTTVSPEHIYWAYRDHGRNRGVVVRIAR